MSQQAHVLARYHKLNSHLRGFTSGFSNGTVVMTLPHRHRPICQQQSFRRSNEVGVTAQVDNTTNHHRMCQCIRVSCLRSHCLLKLGLIPEKVVFFIDLNTTTDIFLFSPSFLLSLFFPKTSNRSWASPKLLFHKSGVLPGGNVGGA